MTAEAGRLRRRRADQGRLATAALSLLAHLGIVFAVLSAHPPPTPPERPPIAVELVAAGPPTPQVEAPPSPAPAAPPKPPPPKAIARRTLARADARPIPAGEGQGSDEGAELSDAQLAGAATAGAGGQGRACDMVRRLQTALRRDERIQAAVADARQGLPNRALFVWNGDWIRSHGQDGAGLAAVREAIMWEVAFAPEACRAEPVHGLVLISLNDGPGSARLVVGAGDWRWSDLLRPRGGG